MNRGRLVIVLIVVVAVAAGVFSLWYHYRNQQRAQKFWGTTTAVLIANERAPEVEVLELGKPHAGGALDEAAADDGARQADEKPSADQPPPSLAVEFNETPWSVERRKDAAGAKGVNNLRRALVLDSTFDWGEAQAKAEPRWQYALAVAGGRNKATVLFDFDSRQVGLAGGRKTALLHPEATRDFQAFFVEQFPAPPGETTEPADKPREESEK